jgi:hypothetical protein
MAEAHQISDETLILYKFGYRKHIVVNARQVFVTEPYVDPETKEQCDHRLVAHRIQNPRELQKLVGFVYQLNRVEVQLADPADGALLRDSLHQAIRKNRGVVTMYEAGLETALGLSRFQFGRPLTTKARWIPRALLIPFLLGPWPLPFYSGYLGLLTHFPDMDGDYGGDLPVGPLPWALAYPMDRALEKVYEIDDQATPNDDIAPYHSTLMKFVERFQPRKNIPTGPADLIIQINPYIDIHVDNLDRWEIDFYENFEFRDTRAWNYHLSSSLSPLEILTAPSELKKFIDQAESPFRIQEAMEFALSFKPQQREGLYWKTTPETWTFEDNTSVLVDYPAYFIPNQVLAAFFQSRHDLQYDSQYELPAEFLIVMINSEFARTHLRRQEWLQRMYDFKVFEETENGLVETYPWRVIYRGATGYDLADELNP